MNSTNSTNRQMAFGRDRIADQRPGQRNNSLRLALLLAGLQAGIGAAGKLRLEFLDTTRRVDVLQLARVERMASAADIDFQLFSRAARLKRVAATAGHGDIKIAGVNIFLHRANSYSQSFPEDPKIVQDRNGA